MRLRRALWAAGLRYRIHYHLPGRPDLVCVGRWLAVFVDGCFWHGCPIHATTPKNNAAFWEAKLGQNRNRDERNNASLARDGWTVLRFWEHEIENDLAAVVRAVLGRTSSPSDAERTTRPGAAP